MNNTLTIHLNKEFFNMVSSGKKRVEYREYKLYWKKRLENNQYDSIRIVLGYTKLSHLYKLDSIEITDFQGLPDYAKHYFLDSIYPFFYTIHFSPFPISELKEDKKQ